MGRGVPAPPTAAFFPRTYDEGLALIAAARSYMLGRGAAEARMLAPRARLAYLAEGARLTARLAEILAWLSLQRALHRGEIAAIAPMLARTPELGLSAGLVAEPFTDDTRLVLPAGLVDLLERSHELYLRIVRLDQRLAEV